MIGSTQSGGNHERKNHSYIKKYYVNGRPRYVYAEKDTHRAIKLTKGKVLRTLSNGILYKNDSTSFSDKKKPLTAVAHEVKQNRANQLKKKKKLAVTRKSIDRVYHTDLSGVKYIGNYCAIDNNTDELQHFKYIKRYKVNGKWRYVYADKATHNRIKSAADFANKSSKLSSASARNYNNRKSQLVDDYGNDLKKAKTAKAVNAASSKMSGNLDYANKYYKTVEKQGTEALNKYNNMVIDASISSQIKKLIKKLKKKK